MKPTLSTLFISLLLALGLTACTDSGQGTTDTAGADQEGLYNEESGVAEDQSLGGEQQGEFGAGQQDNVEIVEEEDRISLPEESPAAGQPQQDPQIQPQDQQQDPQLNEQQDQELQEVQPQPQQQP